MMARVGLAAVRFGRAASVLWATSGEWPPSRSRAGTDPARQKFGRGRALIGRREGVGPRPAALPRMRNAEGASLMGAAADLALGVRAALTRHPVS